MSSQLTHFNVLPNINNGLTIDMINILSKFEATSVDGQSFLNPFQFAPLSSQKPCQAPPKKQLYRAGWKLIDKTENNSTEEQSLNGKRQFDYLFDNIEQIEKKVKMADVEERALSEVSTLCTSPSFAVETKPIEFNSCLDVLNTQSESSESVCQTGKKILYSCFDKVQNKILFKVEGQSEEIESLTKKELLEEDPKLLLYFYETHLKFVKTPEFNPEALKKI